MKKYFLVLLLISGHWSSTAQNVIEKLRITSRYILEHAAEDTNKVLALNDLADSYSFVNVDSAFFYARQVTELSQKLDYLFGKFLGSRIIFYTMMITANYPRALEICNKNLQMVELFKSDRESSEWDVHLSTGTVYRVNLDFNAAIASYRIAMQLYDKAKKMDQVIPRQLDYEAYLPYSFSAAAFLSLKQLDSAAWYARKGYDVCTKLPDQRGMQTACAILGNVFEAKGATDSAEYYYHIGIQNAIDFGNNYILTRLYNNLAGYYKKFEKHDSCIYYGLKALQLGRHNKFGDYTSTAASILAQEFEAHHEADSALKYIKLMVAIKDTIFSQAKMHQYQFQIFDERQRQREIDTEKKRYQNQLMLYALIGAAAFFLIVAVILFRNNLLRKRANRLLESQKNEIDRQKTTAVNALHTLETTQAQLIQSEKMASLGELTAGIAHEIQNPLNFVNNFSELNKELIEELESERQKANGERDENLEEELLQNVKQNLEKIYVHGQRADAIVKGMLQHSRSNTGQKELTDINAMADKFLRLAYHGLRAKDQSFNATIKTDFDSTIGEIEVIPQDIGRVMLNLVNNAFYAVSEKAKQNGLHYEPTVTISTRKNGGKVDVKVIDNADGVPKNIVDKIFQPFFTTKPTGQGTGLGLSLSYDIVKAHGGELKLETKEGEGSVFIIQLPIVS